MNYSCLEQKLWWIEIAKSDSECEYWEEITTSFLLCRWLRKGGALFLKVQSVASLYPAFTGVTSEIHFICHYLFSLAVTHMQVPEECKRSGNQSSSNAPAASALLSASVASLIQINPHIYVKWSTLLFPVSLDAETDDHRRNPNINTTII